MKIGDDEGGEEENEDEDDEIQATIEQDIQTDNE
jgi:hypothetical protein